MNDDLIWRTLRKKDCLYNLDGFLNYIVHDHSIKLHLVIVPISVFYEAIRIKFQLKSINKGIKESIIACANPFSL